MLFGAHFSIAGGISRAFARAEAANAKSMQVFTKNARGWQAPDLEDGERALFHAEAGRTQLPSMAHGSYLVNLGSEDPALRARSIACVVEELTRCERLGISYLVIHPGTHEDERRGLKLISRALDEVHQRTPGFTAQVCLESTAGQGSCLGWKLEHLQELLNLSKDAERLGVCLDTCHLFAAGYDLSTVRGYDKVMNECDQRIGLPQIRCFHLNDSKKPLGSRVDRHEELGRGEIGLTPFRCLAQDERFKNTIGVLETPGAERYAQTLRRLEKLSRS